MTAAVVPLTVCFSTSNMRCAPWPWQNTSTALGWAAGQKYD